MSTYSTYYTIMSMIDGFKSFINLPVMVLTIVASWIMYAKAGEHGWAAIVPFYSSYVKFRIAGKQKLFWGYLVASIASIAGCILLMYEIIASGLSVMTSSYMGSYYDSTYGYAGNRIGAHMGMLIFAVILIIGAMIAALVMNILCCVGLAHAFGKGAGFACGLIFLNVIFICIIAFNKKSLFMWEMDIIVIITTIIHTVQTDTVSSMVRTCTETEQISSTVRTCTETEKPAVRSEHVRKRSKPAVRSEHVRKRGKSAVRPEHVRKRSKPAVWSEYRMAQHRAGMLKIPTVHHNSSHGMMSITTKITNNN